MLNLLMIFIKISLTSFGGGAVMTSLYYKEFVETGIISNDFFIKAMSLGQTIPGPIGAGIGTYIGYELFGVMGIIIANIGINLPTIIIILIFSDYLRRNSDNKFIERIFIILRPITVALIFSVFIYFVRVSVFNNSSLDNLTSSFSFGAFIILIIGMIMIRKYKLNPIYIIFMSAVLGAIIL